MRNGVLNCVAQLYPVEFQKSEMRETSGTQKSKNMKVLKDNCDLDRQELEKVFLVGRNMERNIISKHQMFETPFGDGNWGWRKKQATPTLLPHFHSQQASLPSAPMSCLSIRS